MTGSMLDDAFAHHIWATERLIDTCEALDPQQLDAGAPGTYGSIHRTLHHLVESDRWYLRFYQPAEKLGAIEEEPPLSLAELRAEWSRNARAWTQIIASQTDPEADVAERGEDWVFHAPVRLPPGAGDPSRNGPSQPGMHHPVHARHRAARDRRMGLRGGHGTDAHRDAHSGLADDDRQATQGSRAQRRGDPPAIAGGAAADRGPDGGPLPG